MPDLDTAAVKNWLDRKDRPLAAALPDAIRRIEQDPDLETALATLGAALDQAHARNPDGFFACIQAEPAKTKLRTVVAQLDDARTIRLLDGLSKPGQPAHRAVLAALLANDSTGAGGVIQSSLRSLNRRALIQRMLAGDRLTALARACKTTRAHPA